MKSLLLSILYLPTFHSLASFSENGPPHNA